MLYLTIWKKQVKVKLQLRPHILNSWFPNEGSAGAAGVPPEEPRVPGDGNVFGGWEVRAWVERTPGFY